VAKKKSKKSGGGKKGGNKARKSKKVASVKSPSIAKAKDATKSKDKVASKSEDKAESKSKDKAESKTEDKAESKTTSESKSKPAVAVTAKSKPLSKARTSEAAANTEEPPELVTHIVMVDNVIGYIEQTFLVVVLFALISVGTYQFVASHLFDINSTWPFGALRNLVFFIAMGGAALAAQKGRMISMDFLARKFSKKNQVILRILIAFFVVFACYLLFKGGMFVRDSANPHVEHLNPTTFLGEKFETLLNFIVNPQNALVILPVGAALIAVHYTLHALTDALYLSAGQLPPEEEGPAGH
jgi:TRAP-type C4-dicarboxylate transport system permease small subunit